MIVRCSGESAPARVRVENVHSHEAIERTLEFISKHPDSCSATGISFGDAPMSAWGLK